MISYNTVIRLGIDPSKSKRKIEITTGSGIITSPVVQIPIFRSLGQGVRDLEVVCHDLPIERAVDGLLSLNFLKNFNVHLNFLDRHLKVMKKIAP